jgi:hypothetical protein
VRTDPLRSPINVNHTQSSLNNGGSKSQGSGNPGPEIKPVKDPFGHDRSNGPAVPPTPTPPQNGATGGTEQTPRGTVTSGGAGPANSSAPSNGPSPAPQGGPTQHTSDGSETVVESYPINPNAQTSDNKADESGATHLLNNAWQIPAESGTLDNVHFPIKIDESAKHGSSGGNFFAQEFSFRNADGTLRPSGKTSDPRDQYTPDTDSGGYIGLQPSEKDGKARAVFSGFGAGITSSTGTSGADGGPGASNGKEIDFQYGHKYDLSVEADKNDPNTLNGYVQDVTDPKNPGERVFIGNLKFDKPVKISSDGVGFVEQFGSRVSDSNQIHGVKGTFYDPYTKTDDKTTQGTNTMFGTDTGIGPYSKAITGTTGRINTLEGTPGGGSSFDVSGAGWKPGIPIPGINTSNEPPLPAYNENEKYSPGDLVTYNGNAFKKSKDGSTIGASNGDFIPGFHHYSQAASNSNPDNPRNDTEAAPLPYKPGQQYPTNSIVTYKGGVYMKTGGGDGAPSPDGIALPGFEYLRPAPANSSNTLQSDTQESSPPAQAGNTGTDPRPQQATSQYQTPPYDPHKNYQTGDAVTHNGGIFVKTADGYTGASPNGDSLPGFQWVAPATSESNTDPQASNGGAPPATQARQSNQGNPTHYDPNRAYQPGDIVNYHGNLFVKNADDSTMPSPDGFSIPGFSYVGSAT